MDSLPTERSDFNTFHLHQNLPSHGTWEVHWTPSFSIVSSEVHFPILMSLPSTFLRKKHSSDYTLPLWLFLSSRHSCLLMWLGGANHSYLLVSYCMANIKPLRYFLQRKNLFSCSQFWRSELKKIFFQTPNITTVFSSFIFLNIIYLFLSWWT